MATLATNNYVKVTAAGTLHFFDDRDPADALRAYHLAQLDITHLSNHKRWVDGDPTKAEKAHVCVWRANPTMTGVRVIGEYPNEGSP